MRNHQYDVAVIGSGPGGQKAAIQAAKAGCRVAIIEQDRALGGACVYRGTIPSKTLLETAQTIDKLRRNSAAFEFCLREDLEVGTLMQRLDTVLESHNLLVKRQFEDNHIDRLHGKASLKPPRDIHVLQLNGNTVQIQADTIVIATGSRPRTPPEIPVDHENILDSDSILSMIYLPQSLTILGSGVIACEYASIFSLLGVKVTLIDRADRPLAFLDPELTDRFVESFVRHGGEFMGERKVKSVTWDGVITVTTRLHGGQVISSQKMLVALGRLANVERLGLKEVGIEQSTRGHILVDEHYRTNIENVYAVGDVIGAPGLASCSMEQGRRAICHALNRDPGHSFDLVPIGIYAVPEISSVGLSEPQARERQNDVLVGRASFDEIARGQISGCQSGLLKMVADSSGKLLGVQIIGDHATDLIHLGELTLLHQDNVTVFQENIFNFPTMAEAYRVAAINLLNQHQQRSGRLGV